MLDLMSRKVPEQIYKNQHIIELVSLLFRLLENENDIIISTLLTTLESLRNSFEESNILSKNIQTGFNSFSFF